MLAECLLCARHCSGSKDTMVRRMVSFLWISQLSVGFKDLGCLLMLSQGAGLDVDQPGYKPAPIWDAAITHSNLTPYITIPASIIQKSSRVFLFLLISVSINTPLYFVASFNLLKMGNDHFHEIACKKGCYKSCVIARVLQELFSFESFETSFPYF